MITDKDIRKWNLLCDDLGWYDFIVYRTEDMHYLFDDISSVLTNVSKDDMKEFFTLLGPNHVELYTRDELHEFISRELLDEYDENDTYDREDNED